MSNYFKLAALLTVTGVASGAAMYGQYLLTEKIMNKNPRYNTLNELHHDQAEKLLRNPYLAFDRPPSKVRTFLYHWFVYKPNYVIRRFKMRWCVKYHTDVPTTYHRGYIMTTGHRPVICTKCDATKYVKDGEYLTF